MERREAPRVGIRSVLAVFRPAMLTDVRLPPLGVTRLLTPRGWSPLPAAPGIHRSVGPASVSVGRLRLPVTVGVRP
jgi:hypothetical protein